MVDSRKQKQDKAYYERRDPIRYAKQQKASHLKRTYGISIDDFYAMLADQQHQCAICQKPLVDLRTIHTDHDHVTKQVRGLLCIKGNIGLGALNDSSTLLKRAIAYLNGAGK